MGVCLCGISMTFLYCCLKKTYAVRAAVRANVCGKSNSSAEAEEHTERIHRDVDDGDAELLDEGCR